MRKTATILVTLLLTLLTTVGIAGLANPAAAATRGFWIDNLSTKSLKLVRVTHLYGQQDNKELLPVGTVIEPGETAGSELDADGRNNRVLYQFDVLDQTNAVYGKLAVQMRLTEFGVRWQGFTNNTPVQAGAKPLVSSGSTDYSDFTYTVAGIDQNVKPKIKLDGQNIGVYDPIGTRFDGTALSPTAQGDMLERFCDRAAATCKFIKKTPPGELKTFSGQVVLGGSRPNATCDPEAFSLKDEDKRTVKHSWDFSFGFKGGVKGTWEASFTAKYGGSVTTATSFEAKSDIVVRPGYIGYFRSSVPVARWQVQWQIEVRVDGEGPPTSTIIIDGTVDIPDDSGSKTASVKAVTEAMTDQERMMIVQNCKPIDGETPPSGKPKE